MARSQLRTWIHAAYAAAQNRYTSPINRTAARQLRDGGRLQGGVGTAALRSATVMTPWSTSLRVLNLEFAFACPPGNFSLTPTFAAPVEGVNFAAQEDAKRLSRSYFKQQPAGGADYNTNAHNLQLIKARASVPAIPFSTF